MTELNIYTISLVEVCLEGEQKTLEDFISQISDDTRRRSPNVFETDLDEISVVFSIPSSERISLRYAVFTVSNADTIVMQPRGGGTRQVL